MDISMIQVGSTVTNGSSAMRITERVTQGRGAPGWRGMNISLEPFGGNQGMTDLVPDHLLASWRHVPFEWEPLPGATTEHRYVWSDDWTWLRHETRINFPRKRCANGVEHDGHEWQELHIPTGNPLVEHTQWWRCEGEAK